MAMLLHDADVRRSFEARLARLQASSTPVWGKMTVGQMLWHVGQGLEVVESSYWQISQNRCSPWY
jgi:hypothetical protein